MPERQDLVEEELEHGVDVAGFLRRRTADRRPQLGRVADAERRACVERVRVLDEAVDQARSRGGASRRAAATAPGHHYLRIARSTLLIGQVAVTGSNDNGGNRLALLARAGELLSAAGAGERTLEKLASLLVAGFADWCAIDVLREDGSIVRAATAPDDGPQLRPDRPHGPAVVMRTGEPEFVSRVTDDLGARGDVLPVRAADVARPPVGRDHAGHDTRRTPVRLHRPRPRRRARAPGRDDGRDLAPARVARQLRGALPAPVRGQPAADVGLRRRDAALPGRQRGGRAPLRLHAAGVPRHDDRRHPAARGRRRAARRHPGAAARARRRRARGGTARRTAR